MTLTVADRLELADLVARYAAFVDDRRFEELAGLFTADGVLLAPAPPEHLGPHAVHEGREAVVAAMAVLRAVPVTQHAVVGHVVDRAADGRVNGRVACTAHHLGPRADGKARDTVWHLRYLDSYQLLEDGWRFARREMHVDWIETREVNQWRG